MTAWSVMSLGELVDGSDGAIKTGPFGSQLHQSDYLSPGEDGVPVVMPRDMVDGRLDYGSMARIPAAKAEGLSVHITRPGDVLLARRGDIGRGVLIQEADAGVLCGTGSLRVSLQGSELLPEFLFRYLSTVAGRHELEGKAVGSTMPNINADIVRSMEVRFPPKDAQQRVVGLLRSYDELIENNTRRIQILEEMTQAIYREWFVEFRYPGHGDVPLVDSDLGPIPAGWEVRRVADVATVDKGLSYKGAFLTDYGVPMANLKCFQPGGGFRRDGTKPYSGEFKARHAVKPGDLIVANTDLTQAGQVIGSPAIIPTSGFGEGGLVSHHLFAVRFEDRRIERAYLYYVLQDERFRSFARGRASGTTVLGFRSADFLSYVFPCAPPGLQSRFSELVADTHSLSERLEDANEQLRATRDLLLPRLISGEVEVSGLDIDVGNAAA